MERQIFADLIFTFGEWELFPLRLRFLGIDLKHDAGDRKRILPLYMSLFSNGGLFCHFEAIRLNRKMLHRIGKTKMVRSL